MYLSLAQSSVWAVDDQGTVWLRLGPLTVSDDQTITPAWVPVDGQPDGGTRFTQVVTGPDTLKVGKIQLQWKEILFPGRTIMGCWI